MLLTDGDSVPADLRLIETYQLEIVETILSGESLPVQKKVDAIYSKVSKRKVGGGGEGMTDLIILSLSD